MPFAKEIYILSRHQVESARNNQKATPDETTVKSLKDTRRPYRLPQYVCGGLAGWGGEGRARCLLNGKINGIRRAP